jgi:TusA-related sulfurtransferase
LNIDKSINIKGEVCPYTFVRSKLAIEELESGQVLEVITDHVPATKNVPRSMEGEGNKVLEISQVNEKDWRMVFQKK